MSSHSFVRRKISSVFEKILAGFTFGGSSGKQTTEQMEKFLSDANINVLHEEGVLIDNSFYLYGRPDAIKLGKGIEKRKEPSEITKDFDKSKPIIVLDHQPSQLEELSQAGVDIDFSGHTHDGQIFPINFITDIVWENPNGYLQKGNMHSIVTSGVGVFGPNMRVLTKAEICLVKIRFE